MTHHSRFFTLITCNLRIMPFHHQDFEVFDVNCMVNYCRKPRKLPRINYVPFPAYKIQSAYKYNRFFRYFFSLNLRSHETTWSLEPPCFSCKLVYEILDGCTAALRCRFFEFGVSMHRRDLRHYVGNVQIELTWRTNFVSDLEISFWKSNLKIVQNELRNLSARQV